MLQEARSWEMTKKGHLMITSDGIGLLYLLIFSKILT